MTGPADPRDDGAVAEAVAPPLRTPHQVRDDLEARVMAAVRVEARVRERLRAGRRPSGAMDAVVADTRPRRASTMTPLGVAALVVVVGLAAAGMGVWLGRSSTARPSSPVVSPVAPIADAAPVLDTLHLVRFTFADTTAQRVSLIGDFNAWSPDATPMARDSVSGQWVVAIPLSEGRHEYAFVVDATAPTQTEVVLVAPE